MAKRSADTTTTTTAAATATPASTPRFRFRWLDAGVPQPDGSFHFHALEVEDTQDESGTFVIHLGDTILLQGHAGSAKGSSHSKANANARNSQDSEQFDHDEEDIAAKYFRGGPTNTTSTLSSRHHKKQSVTPTSLSPEPYVARVELMKEDAPSSRRSQQYSLESRMKIRARWFFKKRDIETLDLHLTGDVSRDDILAHTIDRDLILTNHVDDNQVGSLMGPCAVIFRKPDPADLPPPTTLPDDSFVCRYNLEFRKEGAQQVVAVTPYDGKDDDWDMLLKDGEEIRPPAKKARVAQESTDDPRSHISDTNDTITSEDDDEEEELSVSSGEYHVGDAPEAEGSATKGSIQVGPAHQAVIPPWKDDPITSYQSPREDPALVWESKQRSRETLPDDDTVKFFNEAADVLTEFLEKNELTPEEPYSPLTTKSTERFIVSQGRNRLMTLSSISTASSLSEKKNKLLRECNVDKLLEACAEERLDDVKANPQDYITGWTKAEKEVFDARFRSYSGQLRMIAKSLAPSKSFKDVVDYYYRFKIPDQYRRYQEKKREQAVRMVECIETRRSYDNIIRDRPISIGSRSKAASEWSRTGTSDVVGAIEARRSDAKELLLEVRSVLGPAKMAEVADAVRSLSEHSASDLKYSLNEILQDQPDLLQRFLEFLPKRHRN